MKCTERILKKEKNTSLILWSLQVGLWSLCIVVKWALFFFFFFLMELHVREQRHFGPFQCCPCETPQVSVWPTSINCTSLN